MTQEEKFEEAKRLYEIANADQRYVLESLFPELKESEDEKIRKELIKFVKVNIPDEERYIAWLEKQGGQQPQGKSAVEATNEEEAEPRFHEGEWIVFNGLTLYIDRVVKGFYITISKDGIVTGYGWDIDNLSRLWTIQDAKDGDVLASDDGLCLFDGTLEEGKYPFAYCGITKQGFDSYDARLPFSHDDNTHPATKEESDALKKAMVDAGYTFDFEKKELRKIGQKTAEWSKEDKKLFDSVVWHLRHSVNNGDTEHSADHLEDWLKSLKDRITLSEEQMEALEDAVDAEIIEVEDNNCSMCAYTHLEISTEEDLSKICKAGDKAKVIIIGQKKR